MPCGQKISAHPVKYRFLFHHALAEISCGQWNCPIKIVSWKSFLFGSDWLKDGSYAG
jgi:hypothetical protein